MALIPHLLISINTPYGDTLMQLIGGSHIEEVEITFSSSNNCQKYLLITPPNFPIVKMEAIVKITWITHCHFSS